MEWIHDKSAPFYKKASGCSPAETTVSPAILARRSTPARSRSRSARYDQLPITRSPPETSTRAASCMWVSTSGIPAWTR